MKDYYWLGELSNTTEKEKSSALSYTIYVPVRLVKYCSGQRILSSTPNVLCLERGLDWNICREFLPMGRTICRNRISVFFHLLNHRGDKRLKSNPMLRQVIVNLLPYIILEHKKSACINPWVGSVLIKVSILEP